MKTSRGERLESWQSKCPLDRAQVLPQQIPECCGTEEDRLGRAEGSTLGSRSLKRPTYPQSPPQFIARITLWKWPTFGSFDCCDSSNREVSQDTWIEHQDQQEGLYLDAARQFRCFSSSAQVSMCS
ncbi:hypothetical protein RRG08_004705 [Elysia crispata]|uniref:Uncharacterized protein n=1 Tax=Elysia crispata TaxID=231223 RepID=A0AAE1DD59_9GAST|nr:hypothetical protein RRG08_004705 [Elysia crispata]